MTIDCVNVDLRSTQYDICIGAGVIADAGQLLAPHLVRPRVIVVTDETVAALHETKLRDGLAANNIACELIILPPGEGTKSFFHLERLIGQLLARDVERNDTIAAFGGGVIGDLTGFAAAILKRGCRYAQIPTTLLAQVDSSVGGKTGINNPAGKNLVGAFKQPEIVLSDIDILQTLPPRHWRAGYAEIVKYGVIADGDFFTWLTENVSGLLEKRGRDATRYAVSRCCEIKAGIVARDETERGERALLNLGHTFGHALEGVCGYGDALLHGEGVSIGMVMAAAFAEKTGLAEAGLSREIEGHLSDAGLATAVSEINPPQRFTADDLMRHITKDKKVEAGKVTLILPVKIGEAKIVKNVAVQEIQQFLEHQLN